MFICKHLGIWVIFKFLQMNWTYQMNLHTKQIRQTEQTAILHPKNKNVAVTITNSNQISGVFYLTAGNQGE